MSESAAQGQITVSLIPIEETVNDRSADVVFTCVVENSTKTRYSPTVAPGKVGGPTRIPILVDPVNEIGSNHLACTCADGEASPMYLYMYDDIPYYVNDLGDFSPQELPYTVLPPESGPSRLLAESGGNNEWLVGEISDNGED